LTGAVVFNRVAKYFQIFKQKNKNLSIDKLKQKNQTCNTLTLLRKGRGRKGLIFYNKAVWQNQKQNKKIKKGIARN